VDCRGLVGVVAVTTVSSSSRRRGFLLLEEECRSDCAANLEVAAGTTSSPKTVERRCGQRVDDSVDVMIIIGGVVVGVVVV